MSDKNIERAKKLFIEKGLTYAVIAAKLHVSVRTIERWAVKGDWKLYRDSRELASEAIAPVVTGILQQPVEASEVRPHLNSINPKEIVELALRTCRADLEDEEIRHRNRGQVIDSAEKMVKLRHQLSLHKYELELKRIDIEARKADLAIKQRELNPPTVKEWAQYAIAFGMDARELYLEVKRVLG